MATKNSGKSQSSRGGGGSRGENKGGQSKSQAKSDPRPGDRQREKSRGQSPKNGGARGQTGSQQKSKLQRDQNESRQGSGAKGGGNKKGGGGGVIGSIKQHPLTTAAIGAGFGLLALEGVRRAMQASRQSTSRGKGKRRHGGDDDEDDARRQRDDEDEDAPEAEDQADDAEDADEEDDEDAGEEDDEDDDASARGQAGDSDDEDEEDDEDDEGAGGSSLGQFARNSLSRIGSAMRGRTSNLSRAAGRGYDRGRDIGGGGWQSNPLVICAASLAAGAALGFLLPSTKQEDRLMGKPSDRIAGRLKNVSSKVVDQGRKAFSDAADATAKEAEREGLTPSQLGKKVKKIAAHIRDAIADAVE